MNLDYETKDIVCLPQQGEHVPPHLDVEPTGQKYFYADDKYFVTTGSPDFEPKKCYVGGWGTTEQGSQSNVLQSVNVNIMSGAYCEANTNYAGAFDQDAEFCAGYIEGKKL